MRAKGHVIFENDSRNLNLNIIGIRAKNPVFDRFGCQLMVCWKFKGEWREKNYSITTLPGKRYMMERLLNPAGCAILAPGQYRGAYKLDLHRGEYKALCQRLGPVNVYRDKNRNDRFDLDPKTITSGMFGINLHNSRDRQRTIRVGAYSAGCQVFADDVEYDNFIWLCEDAARNFGNKFTYTLINE